MTNEEKNKKCCAILGIHWHERLLFPYRKCSCGIFDCREENPDFCDDAGAVRLLRELEKHLSPFNFEDFITEHCDGDNVLQENTDKTTERYNVIRVEFITTPGLLVDKLIEWKEGKQNG